MPSPPASDPALANKALVARLIVAAALDREESQGAHYRSDYPAPAAAWRRRLTYQQAAA